MTTMDKFFNNINNGKMHGKILVTFVMHENDIILPMQKLADYWHRPGVCQIFSGYNGFDLNR